MYNFAEKLHLVYNQKSNFSIQEGLKERIIRSFRPPKFLYAIHITLQFCNI
jgi:hypothetical protein